MVTATLMTAAEFEQMPDGERFELVNGALQEMAPTGGRHGRLAGRLTKSIMDYLEVNQVGELYIESGFIIAKQPDTVLAPDIAVVRLDRLLTEDQQIGFLDQVPDLAVEIVSPGDRIGKILGKAAIYLEAGTPVVWAVDPQKQRVMIWSDIQPVQVLGPNDTLDGGDLLPGFQLPLADLFGRREPDVR